MNFMEATRKSSVAGMAMRRPAFAWLYQVMPDFNLNEYVAHSVSGRIFRLWSPNPADVLAEDWEIVKAGDFSAPPWSEEHADMPLKKPFHRSVWQRLKGLFR